MGCVVMLADPDVSGFTVAVVMVVAFFASKAIKHFTNPKLVEARMKSRVSKHLLRRLEQHAKNDSQDLKTIDELVATLVDGMFAPDQRKDEDKEEDTRDDDRWWIRLLPRHR